MTLLVGAAFPWQGLLEHRVFRAAAQLGLQRGVILAADSRWTRPSGTVEDDAVKLFAVGNNGLAVYAGNVAAGEDAVKELSGALPGTLVGSYDEMSGLATQALQRAWAPYMEVGGALYVLLAASDRDGGWCLIKFSHEDDFQAHSLTDVHVLGPEAASRRFAEVLGEITKQGLAGPNYDVSLEGWATRVATALCDTCEAQADVTVGGKVLCGITSGGKAQGHGLYRIGEDSTGFKVERVSVDPSEARTLRPWWKYYPPTTAGDSHD